MTDRRQMKANAKQRAEQNELDTMVRQDGRTLAKVVGAARRDDIASYKSYLAPFEGISDQQREILAHIMLNGMPYRACLATGTPPSTYYDWLKSNEEFRILVEECKKMSADRLESVGIDLATGVYERPLVSQGIVAAYEQIYDSRILLALLKARKPAEFGQKLDITSNGHTIVKLVGKEEWDSV